MTITKIEKQKNNPKRYSIFIDGIFAFGIDEVELLYYKLKENQILEQEKYDYITKVLLLKKAKDTALKYLSFKMRSKKQVVEKLTQEDFPENIINKVIKLLEKYNYINDEIFTKAFIKDNMYIKGYGSFKISYELKMLGIDEEVFEKYLYNENFVNEEKTAISLLNRKFKKYNLKNLDYKEKQKMYNYLVRRGFSYDIVNSTFNKILEDTEIYE